MYRLFDYINFSLLLLLGGTCIYQWTKERDYGAQVVSLRSLAHKQDLQLTAQGDDLRRAREDIDGFKSSIASLSQQAEEQAASLRLEKARSFQLGNEKEKLERQLAAWQQSLEEHKSALSNRDENIHILLEQRDQILTAQRDAADKANSAIIAYNELAKKYDDVVGKYNALATQYQAERNAAATATTP